MKNNEENITKQWTRQNTMQLGSVLIGGGILGSVYLLLKRTRSIFSWLISVGMIVVGIELFLRERQEVIKETGDDIMAQLDELDPISRAEVVIYMADQKMGRKSG